MPVRKADLSFAISIGQVLSQRLFCLSFVASVKERMLPQPQDLGFHKHCELCWTTLSPYGTDEHEGYVSENRQYWLCQSCFQEFKNILMLVEDTSH